LTFVSLVIALLVSAQCFGAVHAQDEAKSVNMNTAEEANLSHLKGIGEAKAQPPETIEDIMKSSGIGEKIFEVTNDRYCR
jgi:DNA uptake protein ComE-like DNA-binding protein